MASVNPSAMLAESLSTFSKAAYQAFAEVEAQSRMEVARMVVDVREGKAERDKATRELHAYQLEAQSWKQEIVASKAALTQAELTIAHQAETLAVQVETIAQLRREVTQWKDQSRNWQEHFLRVEQERCAQSSRIDELVVEKLQYPHQRTGSTSLHSPKSMKYSNGVNSAPSSSSKRPSDTTSPTQPPAYKSSDPPSPSNLDSVANPVQAQRRNKRTAVKTQNEREGDVPSTQTNNDKEEGSSTGTKRGRKSHANNISQSSATAVSVTPQQKPELSATVRSSTVIRRVQAIVHVKREESCSEDESLHEGFGAASQNASASSTTVKKKEESLEYQRYLRTPRRKIVEDEQDERDKEMDEIVDSASDSLLEEEHHRQGSQRSRFRQRSRINYREEDDEEEEDDEDEDELMMGAEENHDEVYGTQRVEVPDSQRSKKHSTTGPPPKKRKVTGR